jgi:ribonuclease BN (tRNA processing enzyme)
LLCFEQESANTMKRLFSYSPLVLGWIFATSAWSACLDSGMQLQILGSGGPGASSGRASASYVLWIDGVGRILVDAGSGTKDQFYRSGASLEDIDLVALSHLHPDHSAELPAILWPAGGSFSISGPSAAGVFPSIEGFLDRLFGMRGAFEVLADRIDLKTITVDVKAVDPIDVWRDGDLLVRGMGVPHGSVPAIGYRIDLRNSSIAFASDQNGSDPSFVDFIRGVDVLVIHLGGAEDSTGMTAELHAKPSVWGQMAASANVGRVVVSHISTSSAQVLNASLAILGHNYDGPITVGEDLMCLDVQ